jgi:GNAT superfamily N-acetyltransferase
MIVRPPEQGEYEQITACFAEIRGPWFYSAEYYDTEWLEHNRELFAAFEPDGELAGTVGLSQGLFNDARTTACLLNVRSGHRGYGIATMLIDHLLSVLRQRGARAAKGQAVTVSTGSQSILEHLGWQPTGFLYGAKDGKNALREAGGKNALVLLTGNLSAKDAGTLYIHKNISGPARRMYDRFGVSADIHHGGRRGENKAVPLYDAHNRALYIQAAECGAGLAGVLADLRKRYTEADSVTVALNLCDRSGVYGYEALRDSGYRFCGFDPLGQFEHAIFYKGEIPPDMKLTKQAETVKCEVDAV